jgi:hypothetical protein
MSPIVGEWSATRKVSLDDAAKSFHEKAGECQGCFLFLSCKDVFSFYFLFPSCGVLRIRAGPPLSPSFHPHSWLSDFRSVHGGRSQFSRCCYLIIDLGSRLSTEAGPGPRRSHLISAVELGCVDTISCMLPFLSSGLSQFSTEKFRARIT